LRVSGRQAGSWLACFVLLRFVVCFLFLVSSDSSQVSWEAQCFPVVSASASDSVALNTIQAEATEASTAKQGELEAQLQQV
jgi:hypothetical protein